MKNRLQSKNISNKSNNGVYDCVLFIYFLDGEGKEAWWNPKNEEKKKTKKDEDTHTHTEKRRKKDFLDLRHQLIVQWFGCSTTGNCNGRGFLFVSAVSYQNTRKRTQRQHLIKHTRVYETLFSRRFHALNVRLPPMLIVTARPSFFY